MKAGAEIHFLAGQIFTLGVMVIAVAPRMPNDENVLPRLHIGGDISFSFRRAGWCNTVTSLSSIASFRLEHPHGAGQCPGVHTSTRDGSILFVHDDRLHVAMSAGKLREY